MSKKPLTAQKKTGILSSAITLVVAVCLILVNVVALVVTEKYPVKLDLTANKVFALSQDSIDYLADLQKPVAVTVMNSRTGFANGGEYFVQAGKVLEQYAQYSGNISIAYMDILANPTYTAQYPELDLQMNDILVQSGGQTEKLTANDLFNIEMNWYGGNITSSNAEQAMTSTIMNVTSDEKVQAVFLSGHEEGDTSALSDLLTKNGYEVSSLPLLTGELSADVDLVIMAAPMRDIMEDEVKKLDAYLENGGAYGKDLLYFGSTKQGELPNLDAFLAKWGIGFGTGSVVETDPNRVLSQNPFFGIANFDDTATASLMRNSSIPIAVPFSRPVELLFSESMGYTTRTLLSYAASAGIAPIDAQSNADIQLTGAPVPVAAEGSFTKDGAISRVIVFGTDLVQSGSLMGSGSLSNADYLLTLANGVTEREDVLTLTPKTLGGGNIAITQMQVILYAFLLMIVLPAVVLIVGISIWMRRRRR